MRHYTSMRGLLTVSWQPRRSSASLTRASDQNRRKLREVQGREANADLPQLDVTEQNNLGLRRGHGLGQSNSWSVYEEVVDA